MKSKCSEILDYVGWLKSQVIGQDELVESMVITLLTDANLLIEGMPGLAKTHTVKSFSRGLGLLMNRVQFTPDLLPSDITGTEVYQPDGENPFIFNQGPVFCNILLADEINRAPAKVQSALLEAMEEKQVTVGGKSYNLSDPFMVFATQNPIEQEGTFPLPEAQTDRFLMKAIVSYTSKSQERVIVEKIRMHAFKESQYNLSKEVIDDAKVSVDKMHVDENITDYMIRLVDATRNIADYDSSMESWIRYGASPRGSIALDAASRAVAFLNGRDYVTPDDVRQVVHRVLRHRIMLTYKALAKRITTDSVIDKLLASVLIN
ncbi:MoxR family ATPase [Halosquirtibacter laminarini]|uniref:MoxR family ATPase n=1 Tax=Halosquirtibacter laminarini TaxID=3374600 RepID=A0AC61NPB4_9BACT|nr:MoxR family ATPase [Prolixibacteraceae bacterium]